MVLAPGGRMVTYTQNFHTNRPDDLEVLRSALDNLSQGVVLLDENMNVQFMNKLMRVFWHVSDEEAQTRAPFAEFLRNANARGRYAVPTERFEAYLAHRIELIRSGDPHPTDIPLQDGRIVRLHPTVLPNGGRMLTYNDVTDLVRNAEKLERLATLDGLTGLLNRRHFLALAELEWARFQRYHRPLSLLMIDIDRFKSVNDLYGHDVGDEALVQIARLCEANKRSIDIAARFGGEEFAVLLPEADILDARTVAERLRQRAAAAALSCGGGVISTTVSIGIAEATISMSSISALIKKADEALYQAKAEGRNRVVSATTAVPSRSAAE